jgi:hypothetical protein
MVLTKGTTLPQQETKPFADSAAPAQELCYSCCKHNGKIASQHASLQCMQFRNGWSASLGPISEVLEHVQSTVDQD